MTGPLSRRALFGRSDDRSEQSELRPKVAVVAAGCLAVRGVTCVACADPCEPRALRIRPMLGGRAMPMIDAATCTGCGDCLAVCPVGALSLQPVDPAASEIKSCA
ncbi:MAG: 4Fe-4S dicluster domain-containing protein [Alphaproteobacteria bacterium]|nr:4Fe-4S dicluster domain-containing protein [Alphaproteobacteria bacterium]